MKFQYDKTEFSINENINSKINIKKIGTLTPGISKIRSIDLFKLDKNFIKDFLTSYLYVYKIHYIKYRIF